MKSRNILYRMQHAFFSNNAPSLIKIRVSYIFSRSSKQRMFLLLLAISPNPICMSKFVCLQLAKTNYKDLGSILTMVKNSTTSSCMQQCSSKIHVLCTNDYLGQNLFLFKHQFNSTCLDCKETCVYSDNLFNYNK